MTMLATLEPQAARRGPKRKYNVVDVVQFMADGATMQAIAARYGVTPYTIRHTLKAYMEQNKVRTTTQLVAHFLRNGWVD